MGYTHYFSQKQNIDNDTWEKICKDAKKIVKHCITKLDIPLVCDAEGFKNPIQEKQGFISLNGKDDDSCETLYITKNKESAFNFCKTQRCNYDLAVTAILLNINHHNNSIFDISSDGGIVNWLEAFKLNHELFGYVCELPKQIIEDDNEDYHLYENEVSKIMANRLDSELPQTTKKIKIKN